MKSYVIFANVSRDLTVENKVGVFNAWKVVKVLSNDGINYMDFSSNGYFYIPSLKTFVTTGLGGKAKPMVVSKGKLNFRELSKTQKGFAKTVKVHFDELLNEATIVF